MIYSFNLKHAFFTSISLDRDRELSGQIELQIESQVSVSDGEFPKLQINLRMRTPQESPVRFALELIGLFEYVGSNPEEGKTQVIDFVKDKGLHMLWPYATQMVGMISGQMGMNPLSTKTPVSFDVMVEPIQPAPTKIARRIMKASPQKGVSTKSRKR